MGFREDTATLNRMPLQAVGNLLGLRLPLHGMIRCPFPDHDDRTPSFEVRKSGIRWVCYGCRRSGGPIDFVKTYHGTDFLEAKRWLVARGGLGATSLRQTRALTPSRPSTNPASAAKDEAVESPPDCELYEAFLRHAPLQASGMDYLLRRGLSKEVISKFRIGQLPNRVHFLGDLIQNYGYQRIERGGLLTKLSTNNNWRSLFAPDSLLFPFLEYDQIMYFQSRSPNDSQTHRTWRNLNHRERRIYNFNALLKTSNAPFAICEGAMDTLSAVELGYNAIGLLGINMQLKQEQIRRLDDKQVVILLDWDPQGEARAGDLQNELRMFGIPSTRKRRPNPNINDVNEYLMIMKA